MKARTTKNIDCPALGFGIPKGVRFEITHVGREYSQAKGLGITSIWNDEWVLDEPLTGL